MIFISDIKACKGNTKGLFFILLFRVSNFFSRSLPLRVIGFPFRILYKVIFEFLYGIEIRDRAQIGQGLKVYHGYGLVVNPAVRIGNNVTLRHNTSIGGGKADGTGYPRIGNNVEISPGCLVLGDVRIGDNVKVGPGAILMGSLTVGNNAKIGAGSVVLRDVPAYTMVAGNPAVVIKNLNQPSSE